MRKKLTTPMLATIGALCLVSALFLSFYLSTGAYRSGGTGILLPGLETDAIAADAVETVQESQLAQSVSVNAGNAQQVIATLTRPESYTYTLENVIYAKGNTRTIRYRQMVADAARCRTDELDSTGNPVRTMLRNGDALYAWESGSSSYFEGKNGSFENDSMAMLPTYENVLQYPPEQIVYAELCNIQYEPCVKVTVQTEKQRILYAISTISGLLYQAEFYQGEDLVRQCTMSQIAKTTPSESNFFLPDGTKIS